MFPCYVLQQYISLGTAKLKPQLFLNHFHIHPAQTGARQFGSRNIYTVPCLGMDLVILIFFFVPMLFVSIVKTQGKREKKEREEKNKFDRSPVNYLPGVWLKWL